MPEPSTFAWIATLPARLRLAWPLMRLARQRDPWHATVHPVPLWMFGSGCREDFAWYLEGEGRVAVDDLEGLCRWLAGCDYRSDQALFRTDDFWQHPSTFEQIRKGDCDDFALWAWRALGRLGLDAEFMVGQCRWPNGRRGQHAWVLFEKDGRQYLLEGTSGDPKRMILPLEAAKPTYCPHFGVDHSLARKIYRGLLDGLDSAKPARGA